MSKEIQVYMKIFRSPHPNVCPFYGCVRDGSRVSALALKRISHELPFVWRCAKNPVSKLSILRGVRRGLEHLHSLGIVHNDINRANVCLDESLRPVIIDFDSALGEGEPMEGRGGTPGWFRKSQLSLKENDMFGLGQLAKWLDGWEAVVEHEIEPEFPSSWTEDYLAPKMIAIATPSTLYKHVLSQAFLSARARVMLLNDNPLSTLLQVSASPMDERLSFAPAHSHDEFAEAWARAGRGLRSDEIDVALYPISSDILCKGSDEQRQLEAMIATIPRNLRPRRVQPCLVLFDTNSSIASQRDLRKLEVVLDTLVRNCWNDNDSQKAMESDRPTSNTGYIFQNFAFVQPGGWFSWNRLRVQLWQTSLEVTPCFGKTPHLVATDNLLDFVLEPPETRCSIWGAFGNVVRSVVGIDDFTLFTFVSAQAALTSYFIYKLAWNR
ncbi:kinase-like domain-containing protein [Irpex rosettiformis]|uniref:Kinase-like domain-containing protein n=1 Tax=Irpex rosettiformis TaxID=378272 RepID=A0ACB8U745_9APHY|nr:kinase-like domain-containing protein [Irpex rosettiformis]